MAIPNDPIILFSYLNTLLRDKYPSLTALCEDLGLDEAALKEKLAPFGYEYSPENNRFQ